jgi:rhodanese-related sulfurtransferase
LWYTLHLWVYLWALPLSVRCDDVIETGDKPTVTGLINYTQFCSSGLHDKPVIGVDGAVGASDVSLSARHIADQRSSSTSTATTTTNGDGHILLDVRVPEQYNIASLPGAINIPLRDLKKRYTELQSIIADKRSTLTDSKTTLPIYVLCRRGKHNIARLQLTISPSSHNLCDYRDRFHDSNTIASILA